MSAATNHVAEVLWLAAERAYTKALAAERSSRIAQDEMAREWWAGYAAALKASVRSLRNRAGREENRR